MRYFQIRPEQPAQTLLDHVGEAVECEQIPIDGAQKAAEIIKDRLLESGEIA